ncbi:hypothetical protein [Acrocarpospora catenulata]|uniref:hypothetical protein n=1 Tax=Acrocarpospora catenulata TaxID=2836182 RepID=UPI001BDB666B|nr:hypothetical protein [Acrocarpospora catenulata]
MPTPLTPDEEHRFVHAMAAHVAEKLANGESFRVSVYPHVAHLFSEVTSQAATRLGRPVTGYSNGREFFITLPPNEELEATPR